MISIIVPVYNVEKYLSRCLDSILVQTYRDFELILVDDGSTDRSGAICDEYASRDERIKLIRQSNQGLSAARNVGLDAARGDYIGFVDSDDYIHPETYQILLDALLKYDADLSVCGFNYVCENVIEDLCHPLEAPCLDDGMISAYEALRQINSNLLFVLAWNKLYKRDVFREIRFPNGRIFEDDFIAHEIFYRCRRIATVSKQLFFYCQRGESIVNRPVKIDNLCRVETLCQRVLFFESHGYSEFLNETSTRALDHFFRFRNRFSPKTKEEKKRIREAKRAVRKHCLKHIKKLRAAEYIAFEAPAVFTVMQRLRNGIKTIFKKSLHCC